MIIIIIIIIKYPEIPWKKMKKMVKNNKNEKGNEPGEKYRSLYTTKSGRSNSLPIRYVHDLGAIISTKKQNMIISSILKQIQCVIQAMKKLRKKWYVLELKLKINASELKVLKYDETMKSKNKDEWKITINDECKRMLKYKVWKPSLVSEISDSNVVLSTLIQLQL